MRSDAALHLPHAMLEAIASEAESPRDPVAADGAAIAQPWLSDEVLLTQVGEGSKEALGALFRRHGRAVFHIAWRILKDEPEAADLRQEVFLYLFERAKLFDPSKSSAASWIMQVTYHRAFDRRRYLGVRQHYGTEELDEERHPSSVSQPSTDELDGRSLLKRLRQELSRDQQKTLELHFFEGYSLREIAEQSGQTVGNVRNHYYRALERLRSHVFPKKGR